MPETIALVWGNNNENLLSNSPNQCLTKPEQIIFPLSILKITASEKHISFITTTGDVYSYGSNTDGRLGIGAKDNFATNYKNPVKVKLQGKAKQIKSGFSHSCVQMQNNEIFTWGLGEYGSLGTGQFRSKYTPTKVLVPPTVRQISCGAMHTSFIDFDGNIYMCGSNQYGQLGVKSPEKVGTPLLIPLNYRIKEVACGVFYTLLLTQNGDVYGMGNNKYAQLGLGHKTNQYKPTLIQELSNIVKIQAGYHSGALNSMCELFLWGCGSFGELLRPKKILLDCPLSSLQIRGFFGIVMSESQNRVFIWGNNTHGQLGNGGYISYKAPTEMKQLSEQRIRKICCGVNFAIAVIAQDNKRPNYHEEIPQSKRIAEDTRRMDYYRPNTDRKTLQNMHQLPQSYRASRQTLHRRPRNIEVHSQSPSPIKNLSSRRHLQIQGSPQDRIRELQDSSLRHRQQTSSIKNVRFQRYGQQSGRFQGGLSIKQRDGNGSYTSNEKSYEQLFLNLSKDYQILAIKYKQLQSQIELRELKRSREIKNTQAQLYVESQSIREAQITIQSLRQEAARLESQRNNSRQQLTGCRVELSSTRNQIEVLRQQLNNSRAQLSIALQKIVQSQKQIEYLIREVQLMRNRNLNSPTKSPIKSIDSKKNDELYKLIDLKQEQIMKLQEQSLSLKQELQSEKIYSSQIQNKYKAMCVKQSEEAKIKAEKASSISELESKMADTFKNIILQKQAIINANEQEKKSLRDQLETEKLYTAQVQAKYKEFSRGIQQSKLQSMGLRQELLKSEERIQSLNADMRKMVSEKQFEQVHRELVQKKSMVKQLQDNLKKTEIQLKTQKQSAAAFEEERLKLYTIIENMKKIEKQNKIISEKRLEEEIEKTANFQQNIQELELQIKYEKDYSKKVEEKGAEIDRLREQTVQQLENLTESLEKEKKRRKEVEKEVDNLKKIESELKLTKEQLQRQREVNEDYKEKVLKQYKKKDQLIKEIQRALQQKEEELLQFAQQKQNDIVRLKDELKKSTQKIEKQKQEVKRLNKEINTQKQQIENLNEETQKLQRKLSHSKNMMDKQLAERESLAEEMGNLKRQLTRGSLEKQELEKELFQSEKQLTEVENSLRRQRSKTQQVESDLQNITQRLESLKKQNSFIRSQLDQANTAVQKANRISQQLSDANKQFSQNQQSLNKKIEQLQARVYELEDQNKSYTPRYDALIERNRELDERNKQLSEMVNKAIQIQAQSYKENILKEVEISTNKIIDEVEDQKIYKQRFNRKPIQPQPANQEHENQEQNPTYPQQTQILLNEQPYTKYMNQKIESHRKRVSESAQKLAGILDLDSGIGSAYTSRRNSTIMRKGNDQQYEKINSHMESLKTQKDAFMEKINSFASKMKLL